MQELTLMEKFADPKLFDSLSIADKTTGALVTTLMGMGITFAVLTLLWGLVALLTKILDKTDERKEKKIHSDEELQSGVSESSIYKTEDPITEESFENEELIAVITAALIAASNTDSAENLFIQKIRRVSGNSTAWSHAGGNESIASRRF